jgi:hypothetical protein
MHVDNNLSGLHADYAVHVSMQRTSRYLGRRSGVVVCMRVPHVVAPGKCCANCTLWPSKRGDVAHVANRNDVCLQIRCKFQRDCSLLALGQE